MNRAERYRAAGVDLEAARRAKARIAQILRESRTDLALGTVGAFGGMVRVPPGLHNPVMVTSTDGVGTKVLVAIMAGRHDTIGEDLVNHCVDDILVHGARPLAFLDYIASASVDPEVIAALVEGVGRACRAHDMTLAGGETAELPDLYHPGHYDLAGTIVGVVEEEAAIHGEAVAVGDVLVGYASTGLHTNGYSLARRVFFEEQRLDIDALVVGLGETVADVLLAVHRSYAAALLPVLDVVHGLAHITGGGIPGNLERSLGDGCAADVDPERWPIPPLFTYLEDAGDISREEMFDVFNMGIGMIAIVPPSSVEGLTNQAAAVGVDTWTIGEVVEGAGVRIR